jgi:hypothetical protein
MDKQKEREKLNGINVDEFHYERLVKFPLCLHLERDSCWVRFEENGKYYKVIKNIYYVDNNTRVKASTIENKKAYENWQTEEQYGIMWGVMERTHTKSSLEFYLHQMRINSIGSITTEEFDIILQEASKSFEEFCLKEYNYLPINEEHKKELEKITKNKKQDYEENTYTVGESDEAPF